MLIRGGHIIDPAQSINQMGNMLITDGEIAWIGKGNAEPPISEYDSLDAGGMVVCPGFIDLHCHLRQPGFESKETIESGTGAAAKGGFSTVCCMPNTSPPLDSPELIGYVMDEADKAAHTRVLPIGCITTKRHGKEPAPMKEMAAAGAAGFSDDGDPVADDGLMLEALRISNETGLPVIDHCENKEMTEGGVINQGAVSERLGLKGMPAAAEETIIARDIELAKKAGGHLHIAHVSTAGSVDIIRRAKGSGVSVTAEVTPHHLLLTDESITGNNADYKVNPPLRTIYDIEVLIEGLNDGTIDIIATDHAPHTVADKKQPFEKAPFGISVFETALASLMTLVHENKLSLSTLISKLTSEPAQILARRLKNTGSLKTGTVADITVFDPDREWVVDTDNFLSKGINTPFAGRLLKGRVMITFYGGKITYKENSIEVINNN